MGKNKKKYKNKRKCYIKKQQSYQERLNQNFNHDTYMSNTSVDNHQNNLLIQKLLLTKGYALLKIEDEG